MLDKKRALLVIGIIVAVSGLVPSLALTFYADPAHPYTISPTTLTSADGTSIDALVFTPANNSGLHPGIVVGHGFCGNRRYMQPLSIELVKAGFIVVAIDFHGHGSSGGYLLNSIESPPLVSDMMAGIHYLQKLGNVNKIGLLGHSMGGFTALKTAEMYPDIINATVSIGMVNTGFNFSRISNLMIAIGHYDQLFNDKNEFDFIHAYTKNASAGIGVQYGNFASHDATKVVIGPTSEHLGEVFEPTIIAESVKWFELAFYGTIQYPVNETVSWLVASIVIMIAGCTFVFASVVAYIGRLIFKHDEKPMQDMMSTVFTTGRLCGFYLGASVVGLAMLMPLSTVFLEIMPVVEGNSIYASELGRVIAIAITFLLFKILYSKQWHVQSIYSQFLEMTNRRPAANVIYGLLAAAVACVIYTASNDWSITVSVLTIREYGAIVGIASVLFPVLLAREFYLRFIQSRLKASSKVKEYFVIVGIGILLDNAVLVPVMLITWGGVTLDPFLALATSVFILFNVLQQLLITWVYVNSNRSILSSTVFACLFVAWMMINFFPFGLSIPLI